MEGDGRSRNPQPDHYLDNYHYLDYYLDNYHYHCQPDNYNLNYHQEHDDDDADDDEDGFEDDFGETSSTERELKNFCLPRQL